jgi:diaminohydroxyphosphoribosylaminopyrimidine deaminase/5-amino-6-(5-phosphoribosylamino)uracil reductase
MHDDAPTDLDQHWMRRALAEAARGLGRVEPNPMVGAVVVRDGRLVGVGHHERFGGPHAEVHALATAGASARGATLYVTLEPCCHQGKTPPCTAAVLAAGVTRVVAAGLDPFPRVAGGGFGRLRAAGVALTVGPLEDEARRLNAPYFKRLATGRPHVVAKWAMTLDGKIACRTGDSRWISGEASRAAVHELRGRMDAIVVGIGTALADDPALTARPPGPRTPLRVVLDREARLPLTSQLVQTAREVPVLVVAGEAAHIGPVEALTAAGVEVLRLPGDPAERVTALLDELGRRGQSNVLVEGGGRVLGSFADAGAIDAVEVFLAPTFEGGSHAFGPVRGRGVERMADATRLLNLDVARRGADLWLRGDVPRPWRGRPGLTGRDPDR